MDSFKKNALDWERWFEIIVGTEEGLAYLHTASEVRIIYPAAYCLTRGISPRSRNLAWQGTLQRIRVISALNWPELCKPTNCLLANFKFDFSVSDRFQLNRCSGYMAPEYIIHGQLTEKADGVVVLEIITGRKNHKCSAAISAEGHSLTSLVWQHCNSVTLIHLLDPQASPSLRPATWKVVEMLMRKQKDLPPAAQPLFINVKGADVQSERGFRYLVSADIFV